jgi:hypothetical protein
MKRSIAMALTAAALVSIGFGAMPAQASTSTTRCGLATQINVRGTNAPAGKGTGPVYTSGGTDATLNALISYEKPLPNLPIYQEQLAYPAIAIDMSAPASKNYLSSVQTGITNLVGEVNSLSSTCPHTNIILAGYSQGADVIENAIGAYSLTVYKVPALTSASRTMISSVILFGDPDYRPGEKWDATGDGTGVGLEEKPAGQLTWITNPAYLPPSYKTLGVLTAVRSYCLPGDMFCQSNPAGKTIHQSYVSNLKIMNDATVFIAGWLTDND